MSILSPLAYYPSRLVPPGAHLSFYGVLFGSRGQKSLYVDPLIGGLPLQIIFYAVPLITVAELCPLGLSCLLWSSLSFLRSKINICRPFHGCLSAAKCLQHPILLVTPADLCPLELICLLWCALWFPRSKINTRRPFDGCLTAANHLQHAVLLIWYTRIVPPGPHLFIMEPSLVPGGKKNHYMSTLLLGVWLLQNVSSISCCLLPQQTCAPWGSFVLGGAPFSSCGSKSYVSTMSSF